MAACRHALHQQHVGACCCSMRATTEPWWRWHAAPRQRPLSFLSVSQALQLSARPAAGPLPASRPTRLARASRWRTATSRWAVLCVCVRACVRTWACITRVRAHALRLGGLDTSHPWRVGSGIWAGPCLCRCMSLFHARPAAVHSLPPLSLPRRSQPLESIPSQKWYTAANFPQQ